MVANHRSPQTEHPGHATRDATRVIVLGSTGSIGVQALEVISRSPDLRVVGLSCGSRADVLLDQATSCGVTDVAIAGPPAHRDSFGLYPEVDVRVGPDAAARLVREVESDLILNAIVGFAGLESTVAALEQRVSLALANKESLVSGGRFVMGLARSSDVRILPVDSEHSALFQLLDGEAPDAVSSLVLTASGGPFRGRSRADLSTVGPEDALAHPTWNMGAKITIDSATLFNKGLEVIEAHHLFEVPYGQIEVVVHPGSYVHSLVRLADGSLVAHLGHPDMRVPISYALHYPYRRPTPAKDLDLAEIGALEFERPDREAFPALELAYQAGRAGDAATCALNAANEIAVHAFLEEKLAYVDISEVVAEVLDHLDAPDPRSFEEARGLDQWARRRAEQVIARRRPGQRVQ